MQHPQVGRLTLFMTIVLHFLFLSNFHSWWASEVEAYLGSFGSVALMGGLMLMRKQSQKDSLPSP
jgi:hypothetical protein